MTVTNRRVVVTGLGIVSPIGNTVDTYWESLLAGRSGIGRITRFDPTDYRTQIAGEVKDFDATLYMERRTRAAPTCSCGMRWRRFAGHQGLRARHGWKMPRASAASWGAASAAYRPRGADGHHVEGAGPGQPFFIR
jgi:3-oxoacyl-(acyl-carrier-protein) synthase